MQMLLGIILLVSFAVMVIFMMRGGNPTVTLVVMSILWAALGGLNVRQIIDEIFARTLTQNGTVVMNVMFGAWYSQMLIQTGIAPSLIRSAVELGGDRPRVVISLIMAVVAFMFTTMMGVGAAIAIGVVILPILLSMGIQPKIALAAMTLSIGVATGVNISQYNALTPMLPEIKVSFEELSPFIWYAYGAAVIIAIVGVNIILSKNKPVRSWGVTKLEGPANDNSGNTGNTEFKKVPWFAYLVLLVPLICIIFLKINVLVAFIITIVLTAFVTYRKGNKKHFGLITKTFADGIADSAALILFLISTWTFAAAARLVTPLLMALVGGALPTTKVAVCIAFAIMAPLVLYRGPTCFAGAGIAIYAGLVSLGVFAPAFVFTLGYMMETVHFQLDPTVSVIAWGLGYTKVKSPDYIKTTIVIVWIIACAYMALLYFFG
jgi:H+/gluconate symporter-like permease